MQCMIYLRGFTVSVLMLFWFPSFILRCARVCVCTRGRGERKRVLSNSFYPSKCSHDSNQFVALLYSNGTERKRRNIYIVSWYLYLFYTCILASNCHLSTKSMDWKNDTIKKLLWNTWFAFEYVKKNIKSGYYKWIRNRLDLWAIEHTDELDVSMILFEFQSCARENTNRCKRQLITIIIRQSTFRPTTSTLFLHKSIFNRTKTKSNFLNQFSKIQTFLLSVSYSKRPCDDGLNTVDFRCLYLKLELTRRILTQKRKIRRNR